MARGKITKTTVDALVCPPGKDRDILWDAGKGCLSGFGVVAYRPNKADVAADGERAVGAKAFIIQYRMHGRSRRYVLGEYGKLTPEQARSDAKKLFGDIERGIDPVDARAKSRNVLTFNEIADLYEAEHFPKLGEVTRENYKAIIKNTLKPMVGRRRMIDISTETFSGAHAKMKDTPSAANMMLRVFSSIWGWAKRTKHQVGPENPVQGIQHYKEEGREVFLSVEQLTMLGNAMSDAETVGLPWQIDENGPNAKHAPKAKNRLRIIDSFALAGIRLIALTGSRKGEILKAKWEWVDFNLKVINLPTSKTGKKILMLPDAAVDILRTLPRIKGNPHVIPGDVEGQPRADLKNPWDAIRKAAGLPDGTRIHDLRHSFASLGVGDSLGLPVIGKLLGHNQASTTARYAHVHEKVARSAVEQIGGQVAAAFATSDRKSNVIRLPKRKATKNGERKQAARTPDKRA
ncbi:site-specific integrase [uncultured Rhodoblastus sp.]|uniref:site-specific integrase n=1 Tax=uncultured Rhodoblastus sp. TaxID=543037 RepID=UPI0025D7F8D7|nr:site-specific integrase [uncultured Rhodoblastus sp.]